MKSNSSKSFFLISFLPAIAYWYLEANYSLHIALLGGMTLSIVEISLEKLITHQVHKISIFNFLLILFLGGISLLGDDGIWFKLQPAFTGLFMGCYFLFNSFKKESLMFDMMMSMNTSRVLPMPLLFFMEKWLGFFMLFYGILMANIAFFCETSVWLFWKTIGFYTSSLIFFILMILYMRKNAERFKK